MMENKLQVMVLDSDRDDLALTVALCRETGHSPKYFQRYFDAAAAVDPDQTLALISEYSCKLGTVFDALAELDKRDVLYSWMIISNEKRPDRIAKTFERGAVAFLSKPLDPVEFAGAFQRVLDQVHSQQKMAVHFRNLNGRFQSLSAREFEVLRMILDGSATKEIAAALHISVTTVDSHRANILKKCGAKNIVQLCRMACEWLHDGHQIDLEQALQARLPERYPYMSA